MIRIAICDDEKYVCDKIGCFVSEYCELNEIKYEFKVFNSCESLISEYLNEKRYNIIFLDIEFTNSSMTGIDFGKKIREIFDNISSSIVYVTSFKEYAIDAIKIHPYDYLEKPVDYEKICGILDSFINDYQIGNRIFEFISDKVTNKVKISYIKYFESKGRKIFIHTINNIYAFYGKLSDIITKECFKDFISIHKSYFVNMNYIEKFTSNTVILLGSKNEELPISKNKRTEVSEILLRR